jgi:hypothetical protein
MTPEFPLSRRQGPLSPLPQTLLDDRPNSRDIWGFRNLENLRLSGLGFDLGSGHIRTVRSLISVEPEHQQGHLLFLHTFREEQASPFFKGIVNHSLPAVPLGGGDAGSASSVRSTVLFFPCSPDREAPPVVVPSEGSVLSTSEGSEAEMLSR